MPETLQSLQTPIDAVTAAAVMRHLEPVDALEAGILTPMAGTRPIRIFSLAEAGRFLVLHDGATVAKGGAWATVNYVDPSHLAKWVGEVLGDQELATALDDVASTRKPYGFLVPELRSLIAARVEQCNEVLGIAQVAAE